MWVYLHKTFGYVTVALIGCLDLTILVGNCTFELYYSLLVRGVTNLYLELSRKTCVLVQSDLITSYKKNCI